jgi:clan AA aspartic protease (TIGR02281 family)
LSRSSISPGSASDPALGPFRPRRKVKARATRARLGAAAAAVLVLGAALITYAVAAGNDLNEAGKTAYDRGDYAVAERLFSQAIARAPEQPLFHYHRAVALTRLGRYREAAQSYETVLRLRPPSGLAAAARDGLQALGPLSRSSGSRVRDLDEVSVSLRPGPGGWMTEALLNETRTGRFLVDTGASVTVISPGFARALGLQPGPDAPSMEFQTLGGRTRGVLLNIVSVRVGEAEARNVPAAILDTGPDMDGILGNTFLSRFTVTLDPRQRLLVLRPR